MSKLYQYQQCTGGCQQHTREGMPGRVTTRARPGTTPGWVYPPITTNGDARRDGGLPLKRTTSPKSTVFDPRKLERDNAETEV